MELFHEEVFNTNDLNKKIINYNISNDYKVAVIVFAFDSNNRIIFQRRGPECRDERFKLETIGGRVKETDANFREALKREITEEVGNNAEIEITDFIVSTHNKTHDNRTQKEQDWIYLVYRGELKSGELEISEPTKCLGYERYKIGEIDINELSKGAKETYRLVSEKYK